MKHFADDSIEIPLMKSFPGKINFFIATFFLLLSMNSCTTMSVSRGVAVEVGLEQPYWAPYCDNPALVRYYYFPDIECYYDVRHRDFIYMVDGEWMFGRTLPRTYGWFDLDNCFVVALNTNVYEPWRHFNYYVSHYPRYYYRTLYSDRYRDHAHPMRGFNENERKVVYKHKPDWDDNKIERKRDDRGDNGYRKENWGNGNWNQGNDRNENRSGNGVKENNKNENRSNNSVNNSNKNQNQPTPDRNQNNTRNENRQNNEVKRDFPERRVEPTKEPEPVKYKAKEVGRPVRVQRDMKNLEETKTRPEKEVKKEKEYRKR